MFGLARIGRGIATTFCAIGVALPLLLPGALPANAFPNVGINLQEAIQKQDEALKKNDATGDFKFGIFGSFEFKMAKHRFESEWGGVLNRIRLEADEYAKCDLDIAGCDPRIGKWRQLVAELKSLPAEIQLARLNKSINAMARYADDSKTYGKADYWATPSEFLKGRADCEDYATVKFWTLLELGFTSDQLRLAVVRDQRRGIMHAVVTVDTGVKKMVLDSLFDHVVEQKYVLKYAPIYSANLDSQFSHIVNNQLRAAYLNQIEDRETGLIQNAAARIPAPVEPAPEKPVSVPFSSTGSTVVDWT